MAKTKQSILGICLILVVGTLALYWPVSHHGFVNIDDHDYIYENDHVKSGLSWDNIVWAFTTGHASNWHPLTWISHMVDCQLFGINPGPQHVVNVAFHIADTLLLFLWLVQMTGATWRSAFVAALFAWHPLHVESVAWASERKDVLSTFFWLLTLMSYVSYVRSPDKRRYYLTLVLFALGLMSKPMVVTLPCVLLLLDYWPLGRFTIYDLRFTRAQASTPSATHPSSLVIEKIPFFALTLLASVVTYLAQESATTSLEVLPLGTRVANAALSYVSYLAKTFWPVNLAAMYPYLRQPAGLAIAGAIALLAAVTIFSAVQSRRRPWLLVGWLWFLGTLVPTIGLVQVGSQAMADRYMYIPSIGLFIAVVWGLANFAGLGSIGRLALSGVGVLALAGCFVATVNQLKTWENGETLFRHATEVTRDNYIAYDSLAGALDQEGRHDEALTNYYEAVRIEPKYPEAQYNLGTMLKNLGQLKGAEEHLQAAITANTNFAAAYVNLGATFMKEGRISEAGGEFLQALNLDRTSAEAYFNMGTWLLAGGHLEDAVNAFNEAILLKPDYEDARGNLGVTLMRLGRPVDGMAQLARAVELSPTNSQAHYNLGLACLGQGKTDDAVTQFNEALKLKPGQAMVHAKLALAFEQSHNTAEAILNFRQALQSEPDNLEALNGLAWLLATDPEAQFRSGAEAVDLATKACDLTGNKRADVVETLAASYAEAGRFPDAIAAAQKAVGLAMAAGQDNLEARAEKMLEEFKAGQAHRASE